MRFYGKFKTDIGFENYLTEIKNVNLRIALTKFRLSNHALRVEKGRHEKLKLEERVYCKNVNRARKGTMITHQLILRPSSIVQIETYCCCLT